MLSIQDQTCNKNIGGNTAYTSAWPIDKTCGDVICGKGTAAEIQNTNHDIKIY